MAHDIIRLRQSVPQERDMPLEGLEALALYLSGIGHKMAALKAAVGSLETAIAERGTLIDNGDLELAQQNMRRPGSD